MSVISSREYTTYIGDVLAINQTLSTSAYDTILYLHMIVLVFFSHNESRGRGIPEFFGVIFSFELLIIGMTSINCLNSIHVCIYRLPDKEVVGSKLQEDSHD